MRVILVEDSVLLRAGLVRLLEEHDIEVLVALPDGAGLLDLVDRLAPDVCVLDVRLPPDFRDEGARLALELRRRDPPCPVLLLSQYVEERIASELLADRADGFGYLLKDRVADVREFVDAVQRVAGGGTALDAEVIGQLLVHRAAPLAALTPREVEVLSLMAEGLSNSAIAARLVVSGGAVEKHISRIFTKLGLEEHPDDHRRVRAVLHWLDR